MILNKMTNNKPVAVEWLDANSNTVSKWFLETLNEKDSGKDLLFVNITYGKVLKVMKDVVVLMQEESNNCDDVDITVIPKKWIINLDQLI